MAEQLYDLFIEENNSTKSEETLVRDILTLLGDEDNPRLEFKLSEALLFNNGMTSICECVTEAEAEAFRTQFATLNVQCGIRPALQLVAKEEDVAEEQAANAVYICPACGHQQPKLKDTSNRLDACELCGIVGERYKLKDRRASVLEDERHKLDMERAQRIREVLERAKVEEETMLREEARRQLGVVKEDKNVTPWVVGFATALTLMLTVLYHYNQLTPEEVAQREAQAIAEKAAQEAAAEKKLHDALDKAKELASKIALPASSSDPEPTQDEQSKQQSKMTTALKTDAQTAENPNDAKERHIHEETSKAALTEMESNKLVPPRFDITQDQHAENRRRIQQLLKLDEADLANTIIGQVKEPYPRTLLQLDIAEWQIQHAQHNNAQKTIAGIEQELQQTHDPTQQALILGTISKANLLMNEWEKAGQSLQQASEKAAALPTVSERLNLMVRLANEQALFGNQIAAQQVLQDAGQLMQKLPQGVEPRSSISCHLASGYAMLGDFTAADNLLKQVEDPAKRQKLAEFIDKVKYRVEQVRAEYQQSSNLVN